jgi:hypothetical protein
MGPYRQRVRERSRLRLQIRVRETSGAELTNKESWTSPPGSDRQPQANEQHE